MNVEQLYKNLKRLDVEKVAAKIFKKLDKFISDLNRSQLVAGLNDDGEPIEPEYAESTIWTKQRKSGTSGITDRVTLYDKGNLHKSIFSKYDGEELIMGSFDSKVQELTTKYGEFLGLTEENIQKLRDKFLPMFWAELELRIFKGV